MKFSELVSTFVTDLGEFLNKHVELNRKWLTYNKAKRLEDTWEVHLPVLLHGLAQWSDCYIFVKNV